MIPRRGERRQGERRKEPEHAEQKALFAAAALHVEKVPELGFLYAIPNGRKRHISEGIKLKAEGVKAGYPDIGLDVARTFPHNPLTGVSFHGLRIEMKAPGQSGTLSEAQKTWHLWLRANGYRIEVCDSWQQAWNVIVHYLNHPELIQPEPSAGPGPKRVVRDAEGREIGRQG